MSYLETSVFILLMIAAGVKALRDHHRDNLIPSMDSPAFAPISSPPGWKVMTQPDRQSVALTPPATQLPPVTIADDQGGNISQYHQQWWRMVAIGNPVELRGGCWSACTPVVSHIPKERICVAKGAFLAFHMASTGNHEPSPEYTLEMFDSYPDDIRGWIERNGGPLKLPKQAGRAYWTMYDYELWAMGYSKCK
jgi:hypothetical protein